MILALPVSITRSRQLPKGKEGEVEEAYPDSDDDALPFPLQYQQMRASPVLCFVSVSSPSSDDIVIDTQDVECAVEVGQQDEVRVGRARKGRDQRGLAQDFGGPRRRRVVIDDGNLGEKGELADLERWE